MNRIFCVIVMSLLLQMLTLPVYATTTDVNMIPPPPPAAPNVSVSGVTDNTAQISWPAVTSAIQYTIYLNGQVYSGSNSPQGSLTGLTPHTNYSVYVIANNTGGDSPQSSTINFNTLSPEPIAPSNPTITTSSTTANIIWQPLAANYNISDYIVYLDGQANTTVTPQTGMQTVTIKNLTIGMHTITLSAINDNREGPQSQPLTFTISSVPAPLGVQSYNKTSDTIWLIWQPVAGAASYNISVNGQQVGLTYKPTYIIKGLENNSPYQISVAAVMPNGEQSAYTNMTVTTEPLVPIMTVNNLQNSIFTYVPDLLPYIEVLFAAIAALAISKTLRLIFIKV